MITKPKKPRKDFPFSQHPTGQWCKKIKGKLWGFGADAIEAERKYLEEREYLQAGRVPSTS